MIILSILLALGVGNVPQASLHASEVDGAVKQLFPYLENHSKISEQCIECHKDQYSNLKISVHGKSGMLDVFPKGTLCLTCHEYNHFVRDIENVKKYNLTKIDTISEDFACMRCHKDRTMADAFKFAIYVPSEFEQSVHFRKAVLGERKAPLCYDCHGGHSIMKVDDPGSRVYPTQRMKVCAKCHIGANAEFALSFDHTPISRLKKPVEFWTITLFRLLTLGIFMGLGLYMLLDIIRVSGKVLSSRSAEIPSNVNTETKFVKRMDIHLRLQHFSLIISVMSLLLTGWPLLEAGPSPAQNAAESLAKSLGGAGNIAIIHRCSGLFLIGVLIYHLIYLYLKFKSNKGPHPMFPVKKDFHDFIGMFMYFFGLRKEKPEFEQYSFAQKFDYWLVFVGVVVMGTSGLILMFPVYVTRLLSHYAITLANIIHSGEALLVVVVLFIWHFYNVHFKSGMFPMNWTWLTGRMPKDLYEKEHAAHVKRLKKENKW